MRIIAGLPALIIIPNLNIQVNTGKKRQKGRAAFLRLFLGFNYVSTFVFGTCTFAAGTFTAGTRTA